MSVRRETDPRYKKPWLAEVYRNGKRCARRRFGTEREAKQFERDFHNQPQAPDKGLEECLLEYLTTEVPRLDNPRVVRVHAKFIRSAIEGKTFADVADVARVIKRAGKDQAVATTNRRLSLLRRLCNLAEELEWIPRAPKVKLLPGENKRDVFLTHDQVEALAKEMPRAGDCVRMAAYTGLRRSELLSLDESSIDGNWLMVRTLKQRKTIYRRVPVPQRIQHLLKSIPWIVTSQILRDEWEASRKICELEHVHFHDLRHTYGSFLAAQGVSDGEIAQYMGLATAQMVRRYAHFRPDHLSPVVLDL